MDQPKSVSSERLGRPVLIRIASRSSFLAKWQAYQVGGEILRINPTFRIEYHFRESLGDKNLTDPLWKMPEKGVFTEDFYSDLVENRCDLIVHSWKDLPTEEKEKTYIAATLKRADQRDLLLFKKSSLEKKQIKVFSSSPRRVHHVKDFLSWSLPFTPQKLEFVSVRGNIQTRISKLLQDPQVDGLILAKAALDRLLDNSFYREVDFLNLQNVLREQLQQLNFQILPLSVNPTAAAQGALAIEILRSRQDLKMILGEINNSEDFAHCQFERERLSEFGGGCHQKIGLSRLSVQGVPVFFASGIKENQENIFHKGRVEMTTPPGPYTTSEIMTSAELWSSVERESHTESRNLTDQAVFITKKEALNSVGLHNCCLFTAGLETWKNLAKKGLWINGSTDSLGDSQLPELSRWISDMLKLSNPNWYKITHLNSPVPVGGITKSVGTYTLTYIPRPGVNIKNIKMIYWKSGYEFIKALEIWPELKEIKHACGMGQSAKTIGSQAGTTNVTIYYDEHDWRKSVLQII